MSQLKNDLLLRAARRERTQRTPVWLMRQAGRSDPEYVKARRRADLPLEAVFRDADLCAELSLLPKRIGVDAIIFFQDILTPLAPMGAEFIFRPGPVLATPIRTVADVDALRSFDPATSLDFVSRTLTLVRRSLAGNLPLLGFAGAPFTLAAFLIEGKSPRASAPRTRELLTQAPGAMHRLLEKLADMTADYLAFQIEAGADAVQLFESFPDILTEDEYRRFAHPYHVRIFEKLAHRVPTLLFVKERSSLALMAESGADVLSIGTCVDLAEAKRVFGDRVAFQGNVDHRLLATASPEEIDAAVGACITAGGSGGHILNLSHGVLKDTPWENVCRFVAAARSIACDAHEPTTTGA